MPKKNKTGITISKNTETIVSIRRENVELMYQTFGQWLKTDENQPKAALCFSDSKGKAVTFVLDESAIEDSEDDEDGE